MSTLTTPRPLPFGFRPNVAPANYALPQVSAAQRTMARAWLVVGLAALIGSGLFSVLLVLARTPGVNA